MTDLHTPLIVVLISADAEWQVVRSLFPHIEPEVSPLGQWFFMTQPEKSSAVRVIFFHGGWGKIAAAASAQYVISRWSPNALVNLGTCGGFAGETERGAIILAERTVVYDIYELMGDPDAAVKHYSTDIDLSWIVEDMPVTVQRDVLMSADRDLDNADITRLRHKYGARAADWESGAIAFVAARNKTRCLILRGVTDLVGEGGGEAYGHGEDFWHASTRDVMTDLLLLFNKWVIGVVEAAER